MKFAKDQGKLCVECGNRPALFRIRERVKRDSKHTLCFRCYNSLCDASRAERLAERTI
jgi:hypothetical protein